MNELEPIHRILDKTAADEALDLVLYPESRLRDRIKLAYNWIPTDCQRLLDGGCAFGAGTRHFIRKARRVVGIDPNPDLLRIARQRSPEITFLQCGLEKTPFDDGYFDAIILNDVLEHVPQERPALNEMYRILAPGGTLIITTPHRGLFGFLDTDNYSYYLRINAPRLYSWLYQRKHGTPPSKIKPGYEALHRHYSIGDFVKMLDDSSFGGKYRIETVFRSGLLMGPLASNGFELLSLVFGPARAKRLCSPLISLADLDYCIPYGCLAYSIGIKIVKTELSA